MQLDVEFAAAGICFVRQDPPINGEFEYRNVQTAYEKRSISLIFIYSIPYSMIDTQNLERLEDSHTLSRSYCTVIARKTRHQLSRTPVSGLFGRAIAAVSRNRVKISSNIWSSTTPMAILSLIGYTQRHTKKGPHTFVCFTILLINRLCFYSYHCCR